MASRSESSLLLRSNVRAFGLADDGAPLQGVYMAAIEAGRIVGVAAHYHAGTLLMQAPFHASPLALAAARRSARRVTGLLGPWQQVLAARSALGLVDAPTTKDSHEDLFRLELGRLATPPALARRELVCRHPTPAELDEMAAWRAAFSHEGLGEPDTPELRASSRQMVEHYHARGADFVLARPDAGAGDALLAYCAFTAMIPEMVQIGSVWTPPAWRGRGYARTVVAGALVAAQSGGVRSAVLFTGQSHVAARKAYQAIGFEIVGDYGLVLFRSSSGPFQQDSQLA